jgi:glycosyltransferase involved in cell wall biosynthesis
MQARVLALVPAYKPNADQISASLQSLATQSVPVDICVIDDGSPIAVAIPSAYRRCANTLRLPTNVGITRALIAGTRYAIDNGYEFVCRLDVGDWAKPDRIRTQLEWMDTHPDVDLLGGRSEVVDMEGRFKFMHGVVGGNDAIRRALYKSSPFKHSTFFIRTSSLQRFGGYDRGFYCSQDNELVARYVRRGRVDCLQDTLITYVDDQAGISGRKRGRQLRSRLLSQLKHSDWAEPAYIAGIMRTVGLMLVPQWIARGMQSLRWRAHRTRTAQQ